MPHYLGICFGFPAMMLIVALGFGAIFLKYHWLKQALKVIGSFYMLYLAWQILASSTNPKVFSASKPFSFLKAVMFQWINPKTWLMAVCLVASIAMILID